MSTKDKRGILIANLGSPDSPAEPDVARFLREFLMDPYVVSLPWLLRAVLVRTIVVPTRKSRSAANYRAIWTDKLGPLRGLTEKLAKCIAAKVDMPVAVGMQYGNPSLRSALQQLEGIEDLLVIGLYPQHADSTRTTIAEKITRVSSGRKIRLLKPFHHNEGFLEISKDHLVGHLDDDVEHLLLSFHSLPVSHLTKADPTRSHCMKRNDCCQIDSTAHPFCYRHQCIKTAEALGEYVKIPVTLTYQSRLGRLKWLEPFTVDKLKTLAESGVKKVAVACPSFVIDNLETLSEIAIEARDTFRMYGGTKLQLVPALNCSPALVNLFVSWIDSPEEMFEELTVR